ncbi:MAG TPA: histidine phosphatase family protein [Xanthobacteraceae bacterium]|nr:histidine phosphatase family protein [Xanthobacteraceae bacterium]
MSITETRWWWVRHAPVPDGGRIYGQRDLDCDCTNAAVFSALAGELPREAVWLTSHLGRTHQTAAAIRSAMGYAPGDAKPTAITALAEQHLGDWQGLDRKNFFAQPGRARHPFWFGPANERAPNGESFADVVARVAAVIEQISAEHRGRDIIAVTHGGTIRAALALALRLDAEAVLAFVVENCSITRIDHLVGDPDSHWRVVAVNHRPWSRGGAALTRHGPPVS